MNFLEKFVEKCHSHLLASLETEDQAAIYLLQRGASEQQIRDYKIGYFEGDIPVREESEDFENFNKWAGFGKNLQKRLIFPTYNAKGLLRGIETRKVEVKDYTKFMLKRASVDGVFFGMTPEAMEAIWKTRTVYVTEGIFDHFPVQRLFKNSLCCMTAKVSRPQVQFFDRFIDNLNVLFDMDDPGKQLGKALSEKLKLKEVTLFKLPSHDIGQLWEDWGEARFQQFLLKQAKKLTVDFNA